MNRSIYFYEVFAEERTSLLKYLPKDWSVAFTAQTIQESGDKRPPSPVISTRTQSIIPAAWAGDLRAILSRSAGYDHLIRFREFAHPGLALGHLYRYSGRAVAEHAAMMWLCLLRKLPAQLESMISFSRDRLTGRESAGRRLAVFGVGDIGIHVARIASALEMDVVGVDIVQRHGSVTYVTPEAALDTADVIVCSMNLTHENNGYFSHKRLSSVKNGTIFVNVARGEFARTTDLLDCLQSGKLGGVGLDVYYDEPLLAARLREGCKSDDPEFEAFQAISTRKDVILTPHNAFNSEEALDRKSAQTVAQLDHYFNTGSFSEKTITE